MPGLNIQHPAIGIQDRFLHHLRQRGMWKNGVHELFFRGLEIHRHHVTLNQFRDLRANHVRAEKLAGLLVKDHFDQTLILGILIGGLATWVGQGKWRGAARRFEREVAVLGNKIAALEGKAEPPAGAPPADSAPGLQLRPPVR